MLLTRNACLLLSIRTEARLRAARCRIFSGTAWNQAIAAMKLQQYERAALLYGCAAKLYRAMQAQDEKYIVNKQQRMALLLAASAHLESVCNRGLPPKVSTTRLS